MQFRFDFDVLKLFFLPFNGQFCALLLFLSHKMCIFAQQHKNTMNNITTEEREALIEQALDHFACNNITAAFDILWPTALEDETFMTLLLRIPRSVYALFQLTEEQIESVKEWADKGNGCAEYLLGRYHMLCSPDADSMNVAEELFLSAEKKGIVDATACLAIMYRDGLLGFVDRSEYFHLRDKAFDKNSYKAFSLKSLDVIYGNRDTEPHPEKVLEALLKSIVDENGNEYDDPLKVEPELFDLIGQAYDKLGQQEKAAEYYEKAIGLGYCDALQNFIFATCCDENGNIVDVDTYNEYVKIGCENDDAICHLLRASMSEDEYAALNDEEKTDATKRIKADLLRAYSLGDHIAPWVMGNNYYYGNLGFEENDAEAWMWYAKAALLHYADGFEMLATMIEEGHSPDHNLPEEYAEICWLKALRLRESEERLEKVCEAYTHGKLTTFASEIEQYYLPKYEQTEEDDDPEDDDGRYDAWV